MTNQEESGPPGIPGWVKVAGIIAVIVIVAAVVLALAGGGGHGPGRHL